MIRPLRQRHRQIFLGLGIFLPLTFALGIVARKAVPLQAPLPAALTGSPLDFQQIAWERDGGFSQAAIRVRLHQATTNGSFAVEFIAPKNFTKPDVLAYWLPGPPGGMETLPQNAILLGSFGAISPLPETALNAEGTLILYSLADGEIVDVSQPIRLAPTP